MLWSVVECCEVLCNAVDCYGVLWSAQSDHVLRDVELYLSRVMKKQVVASIGLVGW